MRSILPLLAGAVTVSGTLDADQGHLRRGRTQGSPTNYPRGPTRWPTAYPTYSPTKKPPAVRTTKVILPVRPDSTDRPQDPNQWTNDTIKIWGSNFITAYAAQMDTTVEYLDFDLRYICWADAYMYPNTSDTSACKALMLKQHKDEGQVWSSSMWSNVYRPDDRHAEGLDMEAQSYSTDNWIPERGAGTLANERDASALASPSASPSTNPSVSPSGPTISPSTNPSRSPSAPGAVSPSSSPSTPPSISPSAKGGGGAGAPSMPPSTPPSRSPSAKGGGGAGAPSMPPSTPPSRSPSTKGGAGASPTYSPVKPDAAACKDQSMCSSDKKSWIPQLVIEVHISENTLDSSSQSMNTVLSRVKKVAKEDGGNLYDWAGYLASPVVATPAPTNPPEESSGSSIVVVIIFLLLCCCCVGAVMFYHFVWAKIAQAKAAGTKLMDEGGQAMSPYAQQG
eukprot:Hpha_TRINITY_DN15278_c0_g1::TRINITY_DN15278_c0_g1_i1::g.66630::m.66630